MMTMQKAARAIIFNGDDMLVMYRNKYGSKYYTLVGGRVNDGETPEAALVREVKEETGLDVMSYRLVFTEDHREPYADQMIYLCEVAPFDRVEVTEGSEEEVLNRLDMNIHKPEWINKRNLRVLQFRTPQLHKALMDGISHGFPTEPLKLA